MQTAAKAATAGAATGAATEAGAATVMAEAARVLAEAATAEYRRMSVRTGRSQAAESLSSAASTCFFLSPFQGFLGLSARPKIGPFGPGPPYDS